MTTNPSVEDYLPLLRSQRNAAFGWLKAGSAITVLARGALAEVRLFLRL